MELPGGFGRERQAVPPAWRPAVCFPHLSLKCFFLFPDLPLAKEKGVPVLCTFAWQERLWAPAAGWDETGVGGMLQLQKFLLQAPHSPLPWLQPHCSSFSLQGV